ncbi:hypothetical protein J3U21_01865 [Gilliamella sp. B2776]|uniref:hypothetical protein n=1 Tax=unclassified Gilliamella TaxID=2685620 RepID=UPI00226A9EB7|nr:MULTISPECIES: hypothetical protein [unclassified Gilliamella]MCX8649078.1 hypothetical protein [Gilliamella sp. B2779]MCX8653046.1 hypothetical protein [Gilliamella sp. B2737]MCX8690890.1 hypothetical protein [Gilliamella sp. B2776]MCX8700465.1 hypothetical protein [Gilliamella sp. B2840]MCX8702048.1 hypothetical protein [Gilliamella sp. B2781]
MNTPLENQFKMHKQISMTSLYFNRFLAVRYTTAFFLFLNLYWTIFLMGSLSIAILLPLILIILATLTSVEQIKLYRSHQNHLRYASLFYRMMLISGIMLIVSIYTPLFYFFFPFLKYSQEALKVLVSILAVSLVFTIFILIKLKKIERNEDKHFKRIQAYQEIIN